MTLTRLARSTALVLIFAIVGNTLGFAASKPVDVAQVKAKVAARGVGQGVRVTLADKTEQKGMIVSIGDQSFVLQPKGASAQSEVQYAQVTGVHRDKLSTGQKVAIVAGIAGVAIGITAIVLVHDVHKSLSKI